MQDLIHILMQDNIIRGRENYNNRVSHIMFGIRKLKKRKQEMLRANGRTLNWANWSKTKQLLSYKNSHY